MPNTFKSYIDGNIGTTATTVLTGATGAQTTVIGMTVANITTNPVTVTVTLTKTSSAPFGGTGTVCLVKNASVPAGGALVPIGGDQKVVVEDGDVIQVQSSAATSLDVICSVLEIS
jgi:hypothetical protein